MSHGVTFWTYIAGLVTSAFILAPLLVLLRSGKQQGCDDAEEWWSLDDAEEWSKDHHFAASSKDQSEDPEKPARQ